MEALQQHDRCSDQLKRMLSFVSQKMLVVDSEGRAGSREVRDFLKDLSRDR